LPISIGIQIIALCIDERLSGDVTHYAIKKNLTIYCIIHQSSN